MTTAADAALEAATQARIRLVLGRDALSAFLGSLVLRLRPDASPPLPVATAATDGQRIFINPDWWLYLTASERVGVLAHEVLHVALCHHARRQDRDPALWNLAADCAINPVLLDAGFDLPKGALVPGRDLFSSMSPGFSAEAYYSLLESVVKTSGGVARLLKLPDPGGCGQVLDAGPDPASLAAAECEWAVHVGQAASLARSRGDLPAGLQRQVDAILAPQVRWQDVLRHFVSERVQTDFSWLRPNRRSVSSGVLLPGMDGERLGTLIVAVDTSGSIHQSDLAQFGGELRCIAETWEPEIHIVYHDAVVTHVQEWLPGDPPLELEAIGGGGTSHEPVFAWAEENVPDATAIICLTDLCTRFPDSAPDTPVIWVSTGSTEAPFGDVIPIEQPGPGGA